MDGWDVCGGVWSIVWNELASNMYAVEYIHCVCACMCMSYAHDMDMDMAMDMDMDMAMDMDMDMHMHMHTTAAHGACSVRRKRPWSQQRGRTSSGRPPALSGRA